MWRNANLGIAPAYAVPELLEKTGLTKDDIDVYELNEGTSVGYLSDLAFASQSIYCIQKVGIDPKKVNPNGGAIAIGRISYFGFADDRSTWCYRWTTYCDDFGVYGRNRCTVGCYKYVCQYRARHGNISGSRIKERNRL
jgi:hypothetical protein